MTRFIFQYPEILLPVSYVPWQSWKTHLHQDNCVSRICRNRTGIIHVCPNTHICLYPIRQFWACDGRMNKVVFYFIVIQATHCLLQFFFCRCMRGELLQLNPKAPRTIWQSLTALAMRQKEYHNCYVKTIIELKCKMTTCKLHQSDSNRRIQESKSCALPLGYGALYITALTALYIFQDTTWLFGYPLSHSFYHFGNCT